MAVTKEMAVGKYKDKISSDSFNKGVSAVTKSPAQQAVAQKDAFTKNTIAGKEVLIKNLSKVTVEEWKAKTIAGFDKLQAKVVRAVETGKWNAAKTLTAGKNAHAAVANMKKGTLSDSYERYLAAQKAVVAVYA